MSYGLLAVYAFSYLERFKVPRLLLETIMIPAHRIKILLQTQAHHENLGLSGVLQKLLAGGWGSFWTGGLFVILRYYMVLLVTYLQSKMIGYPRYNSRTDQAPAPPSWWSSPLFLTMMPIILLAPFNALMARAMASLPNANSSAENSGSDQIQILSLFNGVPISILMFYIRRQIIIRLVSPFQRNANLTVQESNLFSFVVSIIIDVITYPLDTIRQNMMVSTVMDLNPMPLATSLFMNGGFGALFAGLGVKLTLSLTFSLIESLAMYSKRPGQGPFGGLRYNNLAY